MGTKVVVVDIAELGAAWVRVENAVNRSLFSSYGVGIWPDLQPVLPYRVRIERNYLPEGKTRRRAERLEAEGSTLAIALTSLAIQLEHHNEEHGR